MRLDDFVLNAARRSTRHIDRGAALDNRRKLNALRVTIALVTSGDPIVEWSAASWIDR